MTTGTSNSVQRTRTRQYHLTQWQPCKKHSYPDPALVPPLCAQATTQSRATAFETLAARFVQQQLAYDPTTAYFTGLPAPDNSRFPDHTPAAVKALPSEERDDLAALNAIDLKLLPGHPAGTVSYTAGAASIGPPDARLQA